MSKNLRKLKALVTKLFSIVYDDVFILLLFLCIFFLVGFFVVPSINVTMPVTDWFGYWSAFKVLQAGENPYNTATLLRFQQQYYADLTAPIHVWNPPILFTILWPIFNHTYETSLSLLLGITFASVPMIAYLVLPLLKRDKNDLLLLTLIGLAYIPLYQNLVLGQIAFLGAIFVPLTAKLIMRQNYLYAGICSFFILLKPHLYLFTLLLLALSLPCKAKVAYGFGGFISAICLVVLTELLFPHAIVHWINRDEWPFYQISGVSPFPFIYTLLQKINISSLDWAMGLFLLMGALVTICVFLNRKSWGNYLTFPLIILLSFVLAPYGFLFDYYVGISVFMILVFYQVVHHDITNLLILLLPLILILSLTTSEISDNPLVWIIYPICLVIVVLRSKQYFHVEDSAADLPVLMPTKNKNIKNGRV